MDNKEDCLQPPCSSCGRHLEEPYIECTQCHNINLCPECFAKGAAPFNHVNDHEYSVRRNDLPIFESSDWTGEEEYRFLQAISEHGYGNWTDIALAMKKYTEIQCKHHYNMFYIDNRQCGELPKLTTNVLVKQIVPFLYKDFDSNDLPRVTDSDLNKSLAGYNAYRSEFEFNYDNYAERLLNFPEFDSIDSDENLWKNLQCAVIRAYNSKLKERHRRYEIIRRHGIINIRKFNNWMQHYEDIIGKNECSALTRLMQLMSGIQYDYLLESFAREKELLLHLYKLYEYRKSGITTIEGGRLHDVLKKRREKYMKELHSIHIDWKQLTERTNNALMNFDTMLKGVKKRSVPPLDIIGLQDYEKLNEKEREFCSVVRIMPSNFLKHRETLIIESEKNGFLRLCDARKLIKIDVNKTRKLYDFLIDEGLIKKSV